MNSHSARCSWYELHTQPNFVCHYPVPMCVHASLCRSTGPRLRLINNQHSQAARERLTTGAGAGAIQRCKLMQDEAQALLTSLDADEASKRDAVRCIGRRVFNVCRSCWLGGLCSSYCTKNAQWLRCSLCAICHVTSRPTDPTAISTASLCNTLELCLHPFYAVVLCLI